ncbi:hypothetical protein PoB_002732300 [Plakobranchus ocellatus]|uniref:Uncharacterized protein n=1 Tax=Plakobranchus ocellatus TaxID=259542 RepID=A0AAV4A0Z0_9GAST|nr:hypothetical protein PoB_002732300 [Plakobranchus ocellatus]
MCTVRTFAVKQRIGSRGCFLSPPDCILWSARFDGEEVVQFFTFRFSRPLIRKEACFPPCTCCVTGAAMMPSGGTKGSQAEQCVVDSEQTIKSNPPSPDYHTTSHPGLGCSTTGDNL